MLKFFKRNKKKKKKKSSSSSSETRDSRAEAGRRPSRMGSAPSRDDDDEFYGSPNDQPSTSATPPYARLFFRFVPGVRTARARGLQFFFLFYFIFYFFLLCLWIF